MSRARLIVASTRLPVSLERGEDEGWRLRDSPGGLATAMRAVAAGREFIWVGWPGTDVPRAQHSEVAKLLEDHVGASPVFIDTEEHAGFYEHFSNRVLWPLFHNLPQPRQFEAAAWRDYQAVNRRFADRICEQVRPGDLIWIHDYQLALVPQLIRERSVDCSIGFFLHIPFPSAETFRALPVRDEILRGILGADLIGFHAYEYVSHFRSAALRILGVESSPETLLMPSHHAYFEVMPIGIDPTELERARRLPEVEEFTAELREQYRGKKVVVGVDRLDYTKGLPQKLLAFEELLTSKPELGTQVVFIQVAAPSRMGVEEYQALKRECDELVGRINGEHATLGSSPLVYINQHVPRERLTALYQLADVALVTPVRDGMNLVCLEYVSAHGDAPGTLILSEFAGAATCLSGAVLVNPHDPSAIARALDDALAQPPSQEGWMDMRAFVAHNTSQRWADRFLHRLSEIDEDVIHRPRPLRVADDGVRERFETASTPLVLLDYDGTLRPHMSIPSRAAPTEHLRSLLAEVGAAVPTYVISGRPASTLDAWLGDLPIGFVCEHGLSLRGPGEDWKQASKLDTRPLDDIVTPLFEAFTERTPGSHIERKVASIAWHYRRSDPNFGVWRAKELRSLLTASLASHPYAVLFGSKVVEVRHTSITKGHAARRICESMPGLDFVFCAGNDRTDEDMYDALAELESVPRIICHVGGFNSRAEFFVPDPEALYRELVAVARALS